MLIAQARGHGGMSEMIHRLNQVANASNLSTAEMSQIMNANTLAPNRFQRGSQSIADYFVG
jgi:hypothetical protein